MQYQDAITVAPLNDKTVIEQIRSHYRRYLMKRYSGWSDQFDAQFDPYSHWFSLIDVQGKLLGGFRLVDSAMGKTPFQLGTTDPADIVQTDSFLEITTLVVVKPAYFPLIIHGAILAARQLGGCNLPLFGIFDACRPNIANVYRIFGSFTTHEYTTFQDFTYKASTQPVEWQFVGLRENTLKSYVPPSMFPNLMQVSVSPDGW